MYEFCVMKRNNIIAAPQIADVRRFYEVWHRNHIGGMPAFYDFMTVPSVERDRFLSENGVSMAYMKNILAPTLK